MNRKNQSRRSSGGSTKGLRFALVVSRFHESITANLLAGARQCLRAHGVREKDIAVEYCPGAFELPQVANLIARRRKVDAIVCLGAVIRGETPHFDFVAAGAAWGIQKVALETSVPVSFGVLTTNNERQAKERVGGKHGHKGWDAALAAIEMAMLSKSLNRRGR